MFRIGVVSILVVGLTAGAVARAENGPAKRPHPRSQRSGARPWHRQVTEAQEAELLEALKAKRPEAYRRLMTTRENKPRTYRRALSFMWGWYEKIRGLPKDVQDAMMYQIEARSYIHRLAREVVAIESEGERTEAEGRLRKVIAGEFDAEQIIHAHKLATFEKEFARMRSELAARKRDRAKVIEKRFNDAMKLVQKLRRRRPHRRLKDGRGDESRLVPDDYVPPALLSSTPAGAGPRTDDKPRRGPQPARNRMRPGPRRRYMSGPSEDEKRQMLSVLKEKLPDVYDRLTALEQDKPEEYQRLLKAIWSRYRQWKKMPRDVQTVAMQTVTARLNVYRLVHELAKAEGGPRVEELKKHLRKAITEQVGAELAVRAHGITEFERRLKHMKDELAGRAAQRNKIIQERLERHLKAAARLWRPKKHRDDTDDDRPARPRRPRVHRPEADGN